MFVNSICAIGWYGTLLASRAVVGNCSPEHETTYLLFKVHNEATECYVSFVHAFATYIVCLCYTVNVVQAFRVGVAITLD